MSTLKSETYMELAFCLLGGDMLESEYQAFLIKLIKVLMPGCEILKNDANYRQGIPDLTIMYRGRYAYLEVKASEKSKERPNQRFYIQKANDDGAYASFIYPENQEEVLNALQLALAG